MVANAGRGGGLALLYDCLTQGHKLAVHDNAIFTGTEFDGEGDRCCHRGLIRAVCALPRHLTEAEHCGAFLDLALLGSGVNGRELVA